MKNIRESFQKWRIWYSGSYALLIVIFMFMSSSYQQVSAVWPTSTSTPTTTKETPVACNSTHGTITDYGYESTLLNKPFDYRVYTPPCYDVSGKTQYPTLYILHGQSFNDDQWDRLGLDEAADQLISTGKIVPLIIVMPQESAYLEDTLSAKYDDALVYELLPWIETRYPVIPDRLHRAIGGLSRGAGWAMRIGLERADLFGSIGGHSLAQLKSDFFSVPKWRKNTPEEELPRIYLDIGLLDFVKDTARIFETRLSEYSYPHEWHLNQGSHTESYWSAHVDEYLIWYNSGWSSPSIVN